MLYPRFPSNLETEILWCFTPLFFTVYSSSDGASHSVGVRTHPLLIYVSYFAIAVGALDKFIFVS